LLLMSDDRGPYRHRQLTAALGTVTGVILGLVTGGGLLASINRLSDGAIGFGFMAAQSTTTAESLSPMRKLSWSAA
jgi:hypothetical protein